MRKILVKIKLFGAGYIVHFVVNFLFTTALAPFVILKLDFKVALLALYTLNLAKNWQMIYWYDRLQTDWFQIESVKEKRGQETPEIQVAVFTKKTARGKKLKRLFVFWVLIIWDTFFGILYAREGFHIYNGIPRKIWWIFALSVLGSTLSVTLGISGIITLIKSVF